MGLLKDRLQNGLDKLISTAQVVSKLQEDITALKPVLVKTVAEVEEMIGPFLTSNALILPPPTDRRTAKPSWLSARLVTFIFCSNGPPQ